MKITQSAITQIVVKMLKTKKPQDNTFLQFCANLWLKIPNDLYCRYGLINLTSEKLFPAKGSVVMYLKIQNMSCGTPLGVSAYLVLIQYVAARYSLTLHTYVQEVVL